MDDEAGPVTGRSLLRRGLCLLSGLPRLLGLVLIRVYQLLISPLLPPNVCRFYPSCSRYAFLAVERHGLIWGCWLAGRRLLRCHPWNPGGVDDVPELGWRGRPPRRSLARPAQPDQHAADHQAGQHTADHQPARGAPKPPADTPPMSSAAA